MAGRRSRLGALGLAMGLLLPAGTALGTPLSRPEPTVGSIVQARGQADLAPVEAPVWRQAEIEQLLRTADQLRTGADGALALLFADRTQVRVHRDTQLTITALAAGPGGETRIELSRGTLWARASRGGGKVGVRTPAATAAIRGTDWAISVAADGTTTLVVLDGEVELFNELGAVSVSAGEVGRAAIGEAPTKTVIVRLAERPQQLLLLDLASALSGLELRPGGAASRARARAVLEAIGDPSPEQRLELAEIAIDDRRYADAEALLAQTPDQPALTARRRLIEAALAARARDHARAAALFAEALPGLEGERRATALVGRYLALLLARAPTEDAAAALRAEPAADLLRAQLDTVLAAFTGDLDRAVALAEAAVERFPDAPGPATLLCGILTLAGRADALPAAATHAVARFPDEPDAWLAYGNHLAGLAGDPRAAKRAFERGLALRPDDPSLLNAQALVLAELDDPDGAESLLRRGLASDPFDPALRANLVLNLLDRDALAEATLELATLERQTPGSVVGHSARARLALHEDRVELADREALIAATADPGLTDPLLLQAAAAVARGDKVAAEQAIDAARRADPFDPTASVAGSIVARDRNDADRALLLAREALDRIAAGGRPIDPSLAATRGGATNIGSAFAFLDLDRWGRWQSDRLFDPFDAASHLFAASLPTGEADRRSALAQGLLLDPLAASGRLRDTDLVRRPFADVALGGRVQSGDRAAERAGSFDIEAFGRPGAPVAVAVLGENRAQDGDRPNTDGDANALQAFVGVQPTARDALVATLALGEARLQLADQDYAFLGGLDQVTRGDQASATIGWSRRLGPRNRLMLQAAASQEERRLDLAGFDLNLIEQRTRGASLELRHLLGLEAADLSWGLVAGVLDDEITQLSLFDGVLGSDTEQVRLGGHLDLRWRLDPAVTLEAGLAPEVAIEDGDDGAWHLGPRLGLALTPLPGQQLRLVYRDESRPIGGATLAPYDTLGISGDLELLAADGRARTVEARWDAEWNPRVFTSLGYDHATLEEVQVPISGTLASIDVDRVERNRGRAAINLWLDGGFGLFGELVLQSHRIESGPFAGGDLPLVPRQVARAGVTWVHPSMLRASLVGSWRAGAPVDAVSGVDLEAAWTLDLTLNWQPLDKHLSLDLGVLDLFDDAGDPAPRVAGTGRQILLAATVRF
jgi:Flp pilus assembly protein TadD